MILLADNTVMFALVVIAFVVAVGVLAAVAGADSRIDDVARRRRYLG